MGDCLETHKASNIGVAQRPWIQTSPHKRPLVVNQDNEAESNTNPDKKPNSKRLNPKNLGRLVVNAVGHGQQVSGSNLADA